MVKFPNVQVQLTALDSNAFAILAATRKAMKRANIPQEDIDAYEQEAKSGDYDHLIQTTMKTVECN